MFCFFYKIIIFSLNKEKDDIRSAYCKFPQLGDSHPAHVIFVLHSAMKAHLYTNQNARTIQIIINILMGIGLLFTQIR